MKISFKKMYFILSALLINQHIFCMELETTNTSATQFYQLPAEMRKTVFIEYLFKRSNNKNNFRLVNKEWSNFCSIKSTTLFNNNGKKDCCGLSPQHMTRVLLCAAYNKNYAGVENILKNSNILDLVENRCPHFQVETFTIGQVTAPIVLNLHGIANHHNDDALNRLLSTYTIADSPTVVRLHQRLLDTLLMDCLAGNNNAIEEYQDKISGKTNNTLSGRIYIGDALKVAINCDHGKCITILLKDVAGSGLLKDIFSNNHLLLLASEQNHLKALEALLASNCFNLNEPKFIFEEEIFSTILDEMLSKEEPNNAAIELIKKYGAKTANQLGEESIRKTQQQLEKKKKQTCIIS